ncbi:MAG: hypothetical protein HRU13_12240 [Phycisphaerales bacterium]|nr:hypothetical protein [Phycisphaerales bacterium]
MQRSTRRWSVALVPFFGLVASCATPTETRDTAPSAALEDLGTPSEPSRVVGGGSEETTGGLSLAEAARRSADDLTELLTQGRPLPRTPTGTEASTPRDPWQPPSARVSQAEQDESASSDQEPTESVEPAPTEQQTPAAEIEAAPVIDPIEAALERFEDDQGDADRALAASMMARLLRLYADRDDGSRPSQALSPAEREMFEALEPVLEAIASGERYDAPERAGTAIEEAVLELAEVLPVRIRDAALATDIYGFAAYRPFYSNAFLAGRSNRVLLYTEPSRFVSTPTADPESSGAASNPGAVEVRLGLELRLFNERGSMLAWRRPEERVAIRSDRPRTEVYLGTVIDLPSSLTVGRYQLKVILRDLADGSEDERVIPIEIVADPRLANRSTRDR